MKNPEYIRGFEITNVVATGSIGSPVQLSMAARLLDIRYQPNKFPGGIYHCSNKVSIIIFRNGKFICAGARARATAFEAVLELANKLLQAGAITNYQIILRIVNVVAKARLPGKVDISTAAENLQGTLFDPEIFPGLVVVIPQPRASVLVFTSGALIIAGTSNEEDARLAAEKAASLLKPFLVR